MWEYYFIWWKENDPFEKLVNGRGEKFDDWMVIPRNMASNLTRAVLRTLVAQFKDDE